LGRLLERLDQWQPRLARLFHRLDGGKASQGSGFVRIFVGRMIIHAPSDLGAARSSHQNLVVWTPAGSELLSRPILAERGVHRAPAG
jgi:hypothetical protein